MDIRDAALNPSWGFVSEINFNNISLTWKKKAFDKFSTKVKIKLN